MNANELAATLSGLPTALHNRLKAAFHRAGSWVRPVLMRWWHNPLLSHARRQSVSPFAGVRRALLIMTLLLTLAALLAWVTRLRIAGAILFALSLGGVGLPLIVSPIASADRVARQMRRQRQDPRALTDIPARDVAWGLALVTLWRLRWPFVIGLVCTLPLLVGLLRIEAAELSTWQESMRALGDAASAAQAGYLPGERLPVLRIIVRAATGALLPWCLLPLFASAGVTSALRLDDISLSALAALLGEVLALPLLLVAWHFVTRWPLLAGPWELLRLVLVLAFLAAPLAALPPITHLNAALLQAEPAPIVPPTSEQ